MEGEISEILSPRHIRQGIKFLISGAYLIYVASLSLKAFRFKKTFPLSKIRSIALGPVHVKGNLVSENEFLSPVLEKKGVFLITELEVWKLGRGWTKFIYQGFYEDVYIKDETDKVKIEPEIFYSNLKPIFKYKSWSLNKKPAKLKLFEDEIDFKGYFNLGIKIPKRYRFKEYVVDSGDVVEIFGYAKSKKNSDLLISNTEGDNFIIQNIEYKDFPLKSIFYALLGSLFLGLGVTVSVFSAERINSIEGIILFGVSFAALMYLYLKYYKIV